MVIQQSIDSLKEKPHDEKKAVASGIAVGVVVILLIGWGFLFIRKIQKGTIPTLETSAVPQDQYDAAFIEQTQQQISNLYQNSADQLRAIRDESAQTDAQFEAQTSRSNDPSFEDDFGAQQSGF